MATGRIEVGDQAFVDDGTEEFGAVRAVSRGRVTVYVENAGEFFVPLSAVAAVEAGKVVFRCASLDEKLRAAIGHAHDAEVPGL
jgi:hypothetical protein